MDGASYFSPDYRTARTRFCAAATAAGAAAGTFPISAGTDLTIDAAIFGTDRPRRVVLITSGLHGVEGFFGSAVQLALMDNLPAARQPPDGAAVIMLHALCPFGFDQLRRTNEDNIDLNRNFLKSGDSYAGSPPGYAELDPLLNPPRAPAAWDLFIPRLYIKALVQGQRRIRQTIAGGQYDFPRGLFFGGSAPAASHRIVADQLPRWFESADRIVHIDFHTGLGPWATYKMITARRDDDPATSALHPWFGAAVEAASTGPTAYDNRGGIDEWLEGRAAGRECYSLCAEFGTYGPMAVLSALRAENQAHHWGGSRIESKARLREVFAPASPEWRRTVVRQGVEIVRQAIDACFGK